MIAKVPIAETWQARGGRLEVADERLMT